MGRKVGEDAGASFCHGQGGNQVFEYSKQHQLAISNICLDTNGSPGSVKLTYCTPGVRSQQWDYDNHVRFPFFLYIEILNLNSLLYYYYFRINIFVIVKQLHV